MQVAPDNQAFVDGRWLSWEELLLGAPEVFPGLPESGPAAFVVATSLGAMTAAAALASRVCSGAILTRAQAAGRVGEELLRLGCCLAQERGQVEIPGRPAAGKRTVLVPTSGTTGVPKLVEHTWQSLWTYRPSAPEPRTWLVPYLPGTYAWYQLVTLGLFVPGQRLVPASAEPPAAALELAVKAGADAVSATPTFWRVALLGAAPELVGSLQLRQVTLGGEPVDQVILTRLGDLFPRARISHVYATTETGPAIVVHDGRAGFPACWLDGEDHGCGARLRSRHGRLEVRSARPGDVGVSGRADWIDTGDRVELCGDRAVVSGRADAGFVNVGGSTISAREVRDAVLAHHAVSWCRVTGARAPLVGELVQVEVVADEGQWPAGRGDLERALDAHCRERLPAEAVPRLWLFLDRIPASPAMKSEEGMNGR